MAKKKRRLKKKVIIIFIFVLMIVGCLVFIKTYPKVGPLINIELATKNEDEMTGLYYYDESRHDRYLAYQSENPDLSIDDVVWQVNIDMDKDDYTEMTMISEENENDLVILVNKHFRLRDEYVPKKLVLYNDYYEMTPETKEAFEIMETAAKQDGIDLNPGSTYRSVSYQKGLYQRYVDRDGKKAADTYSARAGSSEHHTGRAIDLIGPEWTLRSFCDTKAAAWVANNAYKYGFIVRYKEETEYITGYIDEPWHITYVGKECSEIMHEYEIESLEEYYVKYVMYTPGF